MGINWIFFKKQFSLKDKKAYGFMTVGGNIINGFCNLEDNEIFINLSIIKNFTELYRTITHETLHLVLKLNSKPINERIIEKMVE